MMANGLTKALSSTKLQTFLDQMGLNNGTIHRSEKSAKNKIEKLTSFLEELYPGGQYTQNEEVQPPSISYKPTKANLKEYIR
jgi:hypothetical protein